MLCSRFVAVWYEAELFICRVWAWICFVSVNTLDWFLFFILLMLTDVTGFIVKLIMVNKCWLTARLRVFTIIYTVHYIRYYKVTQFHENAWSLLVTLQVFIAPQCHTGISLVATVKVRGVHSIIHYKNEIAETLYIEQYCNKSNILQCELGSDY